MYSQSLLESVLLRVSVFATIQPAASCYSIVGAWRSVRLEVLLLLVTRPAYVAHFRDVATTATPQRASILDNAGNEKAHHPFCQARHRHALRHASSAIPNPHTEQRNRCCVLLCVVFRVFLFLQRISHSKKVWCVLSDAFLILHVIPPVTMSSYLPVRRM